MLSDYDGRRENNFTLVRLLFAWLVLFGHSFPISGNGSDPVSQAFLLPYTWIGSLSVGGFFVVSGYLVTASFIKRGPLTFVISRVARLYPAAIVYCAVAVFIIGPIDTGANVVTYARLAAPSYFRNVLLWHFDNNLPQIFSGHPFSGSTNGSTWTLPAEIRCYSCYILVFVLGFVGLLGRRWTANVTLLVVLYVATDQYTHLPLFGAYPRYNEPLLWFILGALAFVNRGNIPLNLPFALLAAAAPFFVTRTWFFIPVLLTSLTYLIFYVVYKLPFINIDQSIGDISYGVCLYLCVASTAARLAPRTERIRKCGHCNHYRRPARLSFVEAGRETGSERPPIYGENTNSSSSFARDFWLPEGRP
ncbi:MAG: Enoyl-CoA hydratase (EC [uncultured Caballeronia sp.]|nr:MAG: Enoyl-CoA hydratase (EC [uncultured Caballeronia sp.]